jgi:galactonate dehydratase
MGYRALKFDPFGSAGRDMTREQENKAIALVEAVRDAVGPDVEIMIEVHGRFSVYTAIKMARELERFRPYWYEEPVDMENVASMAHVARHCNLPIACGERLHTKYAFSDLLDTGAVQILQPDIIHVGGILEIKKVAGMAEAKYIPVAPHNPNGPVACAATLHADVGTPNFLIQEAFDDFDPPWRNELVVNGPRVENGYYTFPTGPGFGVELNKDAIQEHPPREKSAFNLWQEKWVEVFSEGKPK